MPFTTDYRTYMPNTKACINSAAWPAVGLRVQADQQLEGCQGTRWGALYL